MIKKYKQEMKGENKRKRKKKKAGPHGTQPDGHNYKPVLGLKNYKLY